VKVVPGHRLTLSSHLSDYELPENPTCGTL
jgi:hypothetical protein